MKLVSVIMPTYNRVHCLKRSIDSVLCQTYSKIELIVVDDGSTDDTDKLLAHYTDKRLKIIRTEGNKGACHARNIGIKNSLGEYIAFQDSDDVWLTHKLETLIYELIKHEADVGFSSFIKINENYQKASVYPKYNLGTNVLVNFDIIANTLLRTNLMSTQTIVLSRESLKIIKGFDEDLNRFQDWEFAIRILKNFNVLWISEPLVNVYIQNDSITKNFESGIFARIYIYKKHLQIFKKYPKAHFHFYKDLVIRAVFSKNLKLIYKSLTIIR